MTLTMWGAALGLLFATGVLIVLARVATIRRTQLAVRVLPYVRDLPQVGRSPALRVASSSPTPFKKMQSGASARPPPPPSLPPCPSLRLSLLTRRRGW